MTFISRPFNFDAFLFENGVNKFSFIDKCFFFLSSGQYMLEYIRVLYNCE